MDLTSICMNGIEAEKVWVLSVHLAKWRTFLLSSPWSKEAQFLSVAHDFCISRQFQTLIDINRQFLGKNALASWWEQRHKEGHYGLSHKHVRMFQDVNLGKEAFFFLTKHKMCAFKMYVGIQCVSTFKTFEWKKNLKFAIT